MPGSGVDGPVMPAAADVPAPESIPQSVLTLVEERGRVRLRMELRRQGPDVSVTLTGGAAHIGAVALGVPGEDAASVLCAPGHRDHELAQGMARELAAAWGVRVCVLCGVHLDSITPEEIATARELTRRLTARAVEAGAETVF